MKYRAAMLVLSAAVCLTSLGRTAFAADNFTGTWKLDLQKSTYDPDRRREVSPATSKSCEMPSISRLMDTMRLEKQSRRKITNVSDDFYCLIDLRI